ncbi:MAG: hypothetical protein E7181_03515 [Erysipelotrichaceae bacterium]|jgi:hypothetical protein|nr:hypothetical protein [Erysipelotrichaceae bacterium]
MDYKTKPIGRKDLRAIAKWFRHQFKCRNRFRFDVINAFERIHQLFPQITTEVVEDDSVDVITDPKIPAACNPDMNGGYHIAVREHVYCGACHGIGGYRAHILHEMCHAILCILGFTPILDRAFNNNEIKPLYLSMEWQAKALAGEILVPYDETKGMSVKKIKFLCKVSDSLAKYRLFLDDNNGSDPSDYNC